MSNYPVVQFSTATGSQASQSTSPLAKAWFYNHYWGFSQVPASGGGEDREKEMLGYAQALCNAISADGVAS